ncbi:ThiF family adenylyltransferase [Parasediminibacterium sp. JCM 36343]|uniref:ThiF family adenylyltransferase n=1 Tax=Parasediminibacterium sp. JCM 36343 TaxID=3374279 RepID=UPI00397A4AC3
MLTPHQQEQYNRQIRLQGFGETGQLRLLNAKVLVIGAGGLGCPVLQYLAAAGVGTIGIVDDDMVSLSNLHRQILYGVADIGKPKVTIVAQKLAQLNPSITIIQYQRRLTNQIAWEIVQGFDVVVDGSDNFATRYLVNDICVLQNKPLVYGSIYQYEGQVAVFNVGENSINYRDIFPNQPNAGEVPNCADIGVIGVLPGIIGSMMANETTKLVTGIGKQLNGILLSYNSLDNAVYELQIPHNLAAQELIPANRAAFEMMDYEETCDTSPQPRPQRKGQVLESLFNEIDADGFTALLTMPSVSIIDVRELGETPIIDEFEHTQLPLSILNKDAQLPYEDTLVIVCQSGIRSRKAASLLAAIYPNTKKIYSLKGGIISWKKQQQKKI